MKGLSSLVPVAVVLALACAGPVRADVSELKRRVVEAELKAKEAKLRAEAERSRLEALKARLLAREYEKDPALLLEGKKGGLRPAELSAVKFGLPPSPAGVRVGEAVGEAPRCRAVFVRGGERWAAVEWKGGLYEVKRGSKVGGWKVVKVRASGVVFRKGGRKVSSPVPSAVVVGGVRKEAVGERFPPVPGIPPVSPGR